MVGGWAAQRYGTRALFAGTVLGAALLSLVTPVVARISWVALVVLRVVLGLLQGVTYPMVIVIWSNWAPPLERSTLASFTFAGMLSLSSSLSSHSRETPYVHEICIVNVSSNEALALKCVHSHYYTLRGRIPPILLQKPHPSNLFYGTQKSAE